MFEPSIFEQRIQVNFYNINFYTQNPCQRNHKNFIVHHLCYKRLNALSHVI